MTEDLIYEHEWEGTDLILRAVWFRDFEVEVDDGTKVEAQHGDLAFWFVSGRDHDSWFAMALTDSPEELAEAIEGEKPDELLRLSVWIGNTWKTIIDGCPHCLAEEQRARFNAMPVEIFNDLMNCESIDKLVELRQLGEWESVVSTIETISGQKLSLN